MPNPDLRSQIETAAAAFSGKIGLYARRLGPNPDPIEWNPDEPFHPASTIKIPILVTCLEVVAQGRFTLADRVRLAAADQTIGSGVLKDLCPGVELALEDLLTLMISVSDNTATNKVLDFVSPGEVTDCMRRLGHTGTFCNRKLFADGPANEGCPRDLVNLLAQIWEKTILTPGLCDKALEILYRQQYNEILTRYLPYDPYEEEEGHTPLIRVASKSGAIRGVRHDAGLVTTAAGTYAVALMSKDCADPRFHLDNEAFLVLGRLSRQIFDYYN